MVVLEQIVKILIMIVIAIASLAFIVFATLSFVDFIREFIRDKINNIRRKKD